jgi:DNA-binding protein Fis
MEMCNGNRLRAAQILGIGRTTLYRHIQRESQEMATQQQSKSAVA